MSYGDTYFRLVSTGSTATSAAGAHLLFGSYTGLSTLNNNAVVHFQLNAVTADARVWDNTVTNDRGGLRITTSASIFDMPPMRAAEASLLHFARDTTTNTTLIWTVWERMQGAMT